MQPRFEETKSRQFSPRYCDFRLCVLRLLLRIGYGDLAEIDSIGDFCLMYISPVPVETVVEPQFPAVIPRGE